MALPSDTFITSASQIPVGSTATTVLIPLTTTYQSFQISLAGTTYTLVCKFNAAEEAGWVLDIQDASGNPLACNVPLITGVDILGQLGYLGIGGSMWVITTGNSTDAVPTETNLGIDSNLYFQVISS